MNKAFVREPDDNGERRCPHCGSIGVAVDEETISAHLTEEGRGELGDPGFYCPFPRCGVAYFDLFDRIAPVDRLINAAYPKDPTAPLCRCFGLTVDDVETDIRSGSVERIRAVIERSRTPEARCHIAAPDGRCCVPEVQRYYFRAKQGNQAE
jgi:CopZ-like zinc binding protein